MRYDYGVSFNCYLTDYGEVGGGAFGPSLDYVGNSKDALIRHIKEISNEKMSYTVTHEAVGKYVELGGQTIGAFVGENQLLAVMFDEVYTETEIVEPGWECKIHGWSERQLCHKCTPEE